MSASGVRRRSDVFADKTTVTAPRIAKNTPKRSFYSYDINKHRLGFGQRCLTFRNLSLSIKGAKKQLAMRAN